MVELVKKYGTGSSSTGPSQPAQRVENMPASSQPIQQHVKQAYAMQKKIRPDQCEFTDMTDEECVKYMLEVKGSPPECKGLTDEQCKKFLIRSWENQRQNQQNFGQGNKAGNAYCGDTICDSFEQQNPSNCPQDCGPLLKGNI